MYSSRRRVSPAKLRGSEARWNSSSRRLRSRVSSAIAAGRPGSSWSVSSSCCRPRSSVSAGGECARASAGAAPEAPDVAQHRERGRQLVGLDVAGPQLERRDVAAQRRDLERSHGQVDDVHRGDGAHAAGERDDGRAARWRRIEGCRGRRRRHPAAHPRLTGLAGRADVRVGATDGGGDRRRAGGPRRGRGAGVLVSVVGLRPGSAVPRREWFAAARRARGSRGRARSGSRRLAGPRRPVVRVEGQAQGADEAPDRRGRGRDRVDRVLARKFSPGQVYEVTVREGEVRRRVAQVAGAPRRPRCRPAEARRRSRSPRRR